MAEGTKSRNLAVMLAKELERHIQDCAIAAGPRDAPGPSIKGARWNFRCVGDGIDREDPLG